MTYVWEERYVDDNTSLSVLIDSKYDTYMKMT